MHFISCFSHCLRLYIICLELRIRNYISCHFSCQINFLSCIHLVKKRLVIVAGWLRPDIWQNRALLVKGIKLIICIVLNILWMEMALYKFQLLSLLLYEVFHSGYGTKVSSAQKAYFWGVMFISVSSPAVSRAQNTALSSLTGRERSQWWGEYFYRLWPHRCHGYAAKPESFAESCGGVDIMRWIPAAQHRLWVWDGSPSQPHHRS